MAQQGKQVDVDSRGGFAYHLVKLVQLKGNTCEVTSNTFFSSGRALYQFEVVPCPNSDNFLTHIFLKHTSVVCGLKSQTLTFWVVLLGKLIDNRYHGRRPVFR